jgi:hypothetical protein
MRVGRNIEALAGLEIMRTHVIEKKPRPDTIETDSRKEAGNGKAV